MLAYVLFVHFACFIVAAGYEEGTFHNKLIGNFATGVFNIFNFPFDSVNNGHYSQSFDLIRFINSFFWTAVVFTVVKLYIWVGRKSG